MDLQGEFKICPKVMAHFKMVVSHLSWLKTYQTKRTTYDYHHLKGFQDRSTYTRYTGYLLFATNPETPCINQLQKKTKHCLKWEFISALSGGKDKTRRGTVRSRTRAAAMVTNIQEWKWDFDIIPRYYSY